MSVKKVLTRYVSYANIPIQTRIVSLGGDDLMRSNLVKARLSMGYTQEDIARQIGVTRACYSNYESGIREPSIQKIIQIKKLLNVVSDEIFLKDEDTIRNDALSKKSAPPPEEERRQQNIAGWG